MPFLPSAPIATGHTGRYSVRIYSVSGNKATLQVHCLADSKVYRLTSKENHPGPQLFPTETLFTVI